MAEELDPLDEAALGMMVAESLVTADQLRRVRGMLLKGKPLQEALSKVPIVDPLQFLRIQRTVSGEDIAPSTSLIHAQAVLKEPTPVSGDKPRVPLAGFGKRQADNALDFDSIDLEGSGFVIEPLPVAPVDSTDENVLTGAKTEVVTSPSTPLPASERRRIDLNQMLEPPDSMESFLNTTSTGTVYPLEDHDDIPMLKALHALVAELASMEGLGFVIDWVGGEDGDVRFFLKSGRLAMHRSLEPGDAARFINRLKIMARIEPWRRDSPRGSFLVTDKGRQYRLLLKVMTRSDDTESATVYLVYT